jgi:hypothetical protein
MKYTVQKSLLLAFTVEAASPSEAVDKMLDRDDAAFEVIDCDYYVFDAGGEAVDYDGDKFLDLPSAQ